MVKYLYLEKPVGEVSSSGAEIIKQYAAYPPKLRMIFKFQGFFIIQELIIIVKAIKYKYNRHHINGIIIEYVVVKT